MGRVTDRRRVERINEGGRSFRPDTLIVEEPLEIQINGEPLTVTMRTPGDDVDLALGWLYAEGIISSYEDVITAKHCTDSDLNVLDVRLAPHVPVPDRAGRGFTVSSACGACGTSSLEALREVTAKAVRWRIGDDDVEVGVDLLAALPDRLRASQRAFARTGGVHAAGLFDASGTEVAVREDVGRHNAVDKIVGGRLRDGGVPLTGHVLMASGRVGYEIVQKAAMAGIPVLAAVSAPSTLAVDLAADLGMTLVGFVRGSSMNVYSGSARVSSS
ncbi:sulfurtransferase FdhD [Actinorhabdospora filicis]|uniref:Sulfur carrier protein FdhD n=1 Tax=Actinorhabdospora filicis TaxID=1785913 RepID=A0A9W6SQY3_9ACTN|nr:formate dehydrogenase accessory sulfurtransferase FdhD [Actinorhabdospora filicis]GLZ80488.1 sulfurtransferase FdhD [Actinorhabdospora filicis]